MYKARYRLNNGLWQSWAVFETEEEANDVITHQAKGGIVEVFLNEPSDVTQEWVRQQMKAYGLSQVAIVKELGINSNGLSNWLNSDKAPSKSLAAMFYYYFRTKHIQRMYGHPQ